jgi:hypothetical protein
MIFFNYLRKERPELLNFKTKGRDPWQIIHGWLNQNGSSPGSAGEAAKV